MPKIPGYGEDRVRENALPRVRFSADAPIEAFGGGEAASGPGRALRGLAGQVEEIALKERKKALDVMTQDGYAKIVTEKNRLVYDPKEGAISRRGKAALGIDEEYGSAFDTFADKVEEDMPDPEARSMFKVMRQRERLELSGMLNRHTSQEIEALHDSTFKALVSTMTDDAVSNYDTPGKIADNISLLKSAVSNYAASKGMTGDAAPVAQDLWRTVESGVHVGVVNRLIASNKYDDARAYFKANEKGIKGLDADGVERAISSMDDARKKDLYLQATNIVDKRPGAKPKDIIPFFDQLTLEQRRALEHRSRDVENDDNTWLDFLTLSKREMASITRADFETKYWVKFDEDHRSKAESRWDMAREPGGSGQEFKSVRSDHEMIVDSLRRVKQVPDYGKIEGDAATTVRVFEDKVDDAFKAHFARTGKNPSDSEKQEIIGSLLVRKAFVERSFAPDREKIIALMDEDEIKRSYRSMGDIPPGDKAMLVNLARELRRVKPDVTDDKAAMLMKRQIERAYAAALAGGNREQIISIMSED
jgi:hypothetical protein